jgi:hypothetical protein
MQSGVRLQSTTMHFGAPHREDLRSGMCPSCRETMCCRDRWSFQRTQHAPPNSLRREKFSGNASRTASKPLLTCYWISVCAKANGAILLRSLAWSRERRTPEEHTAARATSEQVWCRCGPLPPCARCAREERSGAVARRTKVAVLSVWLRELRLDGCATTLDIRRRRGFPIRRWRTGGLGCCATVRSAAVL